MAQRKELGPMHDNDDDNDYDEEEEAEYQSMHQFRMNMDPADRKWNAEKIKRMKRKRSRQLHIDPCYEDLQLNDPQFHDADDEEYQSHIDSISFTKKNKVLKVKPQCRLSNKEMRELREIDPESWFGFDIDDDDDEQEEEKDEHKQEVKENRRRISQRYLQLFGIKIPKTTLCYLVPGFFALVWLVIC